MKSVFKSSALLRHPCRHPQVSLFLSKFPCEVTFQSINKALVLSLSGMSLRVNNQDYSSNELRLAVALRLYAHVSDETLGSIIATRRNGIGAQPVPCSNVVSMLQQSPHASHRMIYTVVNNDRTSWEHQARQAYREWSDAYSQVVGRYV
jgi:hypothetical protein